MPQRGTTGYPTFGLIKHECNSENIFRASDRYATGRFDRNFYPYLIPTMNNSYFNNNNSNNNNNNNNNNNDNNKYTWYSYYVPPYWHTLTINSSLYTDNGIRIM